VRCSACSYSADRGCEPLAELPRCECGALLRPDVVWFEEMLPPDVWARAERAVQSCACLLVVGTSAIVYPAAGLIDLAQSGGTKVIEVNLNTTEASSGVDIALHGPAGKILPEL